jgi:hypothetical protein
MQAKNPYTKGHPSYKACFSLQNGWLYKKGFQYFPSLPVLHYLQAVLLIKIGTIFMNNLYNTLSIYSGLPRRPLISLDVYDLLILIC